MILSVTNKLYSYTLHNRMIINVHVFYVPRLILYLEETTSHADL
jgi:hypothetical protein